MNQVPTEVTDAIRDGKPLPDARLDALSTFTASRAETRVLPTAAEGFLAEGFTETDILQVLLAVSVKAISNYTNHLFHTPVDTMLTHRAWPE
jgi:alkylhydroperoxidase family enzyme